MAITQLITNDAIMVIDQSNLLSSLGLPANAIITGGTWDPNKKQLTITASQTVSGPTVTVP